MNYKAKFRKDTVAKANEILGSLTHGCSRIVRQFDSLDQNAVVVATTLRGKTYVDDMASKCIRIYARDHKESTAEALAAMTFYFYQVRSRREA